MTRNDEVPQEVGEALEMLTVFACNPSAAAPRAHAIRDYLTTLRAKLEAAEGEVARLREDARRAQTALMAIQQRTQCTSYGMGADVAQIADAALQERTP